MRLAKGVNDIDGHFNTLFGGGGTEVSLTLASRLDTMKEAQKCRSVEKMVERGALQGNA